MTEKRRAGWKRRDTRPATNRALAAAAARLLDRLRKERLPEDAQEAAALRKATRNAFLLVEQLRTLAAAEAPVPAISRPAPRKNKIDRPFFFDPDVPVLTGNAGCVDLEKFRRRVDRAMSPARKRA